MASGLASLIVCVPQLYNYILIVLFAVVIVVFDLSDESSITSISRWMEDATASANNPLKFVVGTKKDMVV